LIPNHLVPIETPIGLARSNRARSTNIERNAMATPNELRERTKLGIANAKAKEAERVRKEAEDALKRELARTLKEAEVAKDVINRAHEAMFTAADNGFSVIRAFEIPETDIIHGKIISYKGATKMIIDHFTELNFSVVVDSNDLATGFLNTDTISISGSISGYAKQYIKIGW
jgi:hypothetical protein